MGRGMRPFADFATVRRLQRLTAGCVQIRLINYDTGNHPIHLHGHRVYVIATSQYPESEWLNSPRYLQVRHPHSATGGLRETSPLRGARSSQLSRPRSATPSSCPRRKMASLLAGRKLCTIRGQQGYGLSTAISTGTCRLGSWRSSLKMLPSWLGRVPSSAPPFFDERNALGRPLPETLMLGARRWGSSCQKTCLRSVACPGQPTKHCWRTATSVVQHLRSGWFLLYYIARGCNSLHCCSSLGGWFRMIRPFIRLAQDNFCEKVDSYLRSQTHERRSRCCRLKRRNSPRATRARDHAA